MKNQIPKLFGALTLLALSTLNPQLSIVFAQGTAFTYQGRLNSGGAPANGSYDIAFSLFATNTSGVAIAGPVTNAAVSVTNGLFTTLVDFGNAFTSGSNWLEIAVSTNGANSFFTLVPRQQLTPVPYAIYAGSGGGLPGLVVQPGSGGAPNLIGGSPVNFVSSGVFGATIGGGGATSYFGEAFSNSVSGEFGTVGGGFQNNAGSRATVGGGDNDTASGQAATVGGGEYNTVSGGDATVGGGSDNTASGECATVSGGTLNTAGGSGSFVGGGGYDGFSYGINTAYGSASVIGGGMDNNIKSGGAYGFIGGGYQNTASGGYATVGGGYRNTASGGYATVGGGAQNTATGQGANVGGGGDDGITVSGNNATGNASVIGGGLGNNIAGGCTYAFIGSGDNNWIIQANPYATIAGGQNNTNAGYAVFIGGGRNNSVTSPSFDSVVSGGYFNAIQNAADAVIGGGDANTILAGYIDNTIGGGGGNLISTNNSASVIAGGSGNVIAGNVANGFIGGGYRNLNTGTMSVIAGGNLNAVQNGAQYAAIPGGQNNTAAGNYSFAAGDNADAANAGAFVWSDGSTNTISTANRQFIVRASGGFLFYSSSSPVGVALAPGSGSWSTMSDRNAKDDFAPVSPQAVLARVTALPMTTWSYKTEPGVRHVGPMAQDFYAAFNVGEDNQHIANVDEGGVALAAIQGLNQKLNEKDAEIADLKARLEKLERLIESKNGDVK